MERIQVTRYVAEGCKRRFSSKKRCLEHESICMCWTNPKNKTCKTCRHGIYAPYEHDTGAGGEWECWNGDNDDAHSGAPNGVDYISVNCKHWEMKRRLA